MKQTRGKIGIREYVAIIGLTIGSKLSDDTPTIIYSTAKNAAWISLLVMSLLAIIPIMLLIKVMSAHKGKNLHEVNLHLFGRVLGNFFSLGLLIMGFTFVVIDSERYVDIIGSMYFSKTPLVAIYIVLFTVCAYGAKRGIEHIGGTAWLAYFDIKATLLVALVITFGKGIPELVFPLWGPGIVEIVKTAGSKMSVFADIFFLALIAPLVGTFKEYRRGTLIGFGIGAVEITVSLVLFVMLFDFTSIEVLKYPFHETIRYISIGFLTNVESIFLPFWLVAALIRFSVYLYLVVVLFGGIFKIKDFEYLVPLMAVLIIALGTASTVPEYRIPQLREHLLTLLSPLFFLSPCFMWLAAKLRGDFKNGTSAENH
jgi:spore germination protein (amino acid permease)